EGEDGGGLPVLGAVLPVRLLGASGEGVAVLPGTEVESGEIGELQRRHGTAAIGRTVDSTVVNTDQMTVGGQTYIAFERVRTVLDRFAIRGQGVFGGVLGGPAVCDDLGEVLACVGHRVMVPPRAGTRAVGAEGAVRRSGRRHRNGAP